MKLLDTAINQEQFVYLVRKGHTCQISRSIHHVDSSIQFKILAEIVNCGLYDAEIALVIIKQAKFDLAYGDNLLIRWAAKFGHVDIFKHLMDVENIDINCGEEYKPINLACMNNHSEIVQLLLQDSRLSTNEFITDPITHAAVNGHDQIVDLLLKDGRFNPAHSDNFAIRWASHCGHLKVVELLIKDPRVNPASNENGALLWATQGGHFDVVSLLLGDNRVDPNVQKNSIIYLAYSDGRCDLVYKLLRDSRVLDSYLKEPLWILPEHLLSMIGGTVLSPFLIGFDINTAVFFSGIGTLIFYVITGGRVPSYLGSSFAFVGVVRVATGFTDAQLGTINPNIGDALGGIMASGVLYAAVALIVMLSGYRWIEKILPPIVTGSIIIAIGLNLSVTAVNDASMTADSAWQATVTAIIIACVSVFAKGFFSRLPVLFGLFGGFVIAIIFDSALGHNAISYDALKSTAWVGPPKFYTPTLNWKAISTIAPVVIIQVAENLGHVKAVSVITNTELLPVLGRAFLGDAVACILSSSFGGSGLTTYAENIGVMAVTRIYSTLVFCVAATFAILLGFVPKFAALISTIPSGVIGGLEIILFGLVAATGARIWIQNKIDFSDSANLITAAVAIVLGAGMANGKAITFGQYIEFDGLGSATLICIITHLCLKIIPDTFSGKSSSSPLQESLEKDLDNAYSH
ncbi:hypothetical protein HDV04_004095 [Boothiomyces sp. JEL0838]|nr:hypothetical protein HDV04_004082 [Boothiomyces sp. JEL0838]KAJ3311383.1 hypothetical protein HDV04_004095 [Boothiomyces sp. JEL0838]